MSSGVFWQSPYVNIFKQFGAGKWKKCTKEGDVSTSMDRDIKATVYRICGSIPASNYISIPKTSTQSLNLTGHHFYLLFRPLPSKFFVVHLEVVTTAGIVVRISFSNLFKEFKSTSTWLQFPYHLHHHQQGEGQGAGQQQGRRGGGLLQPAWKSTRWALVSLDFKSTLSKYLSCEHAYLKNIKLCANMLVKNAFTSDIEYAPLDGDGGGNGGHYFKSLPRDMSLPLPKDADFLEVYDYVCFPPEERKVSLLREQRGRQQLKGMKSSEMVCIVSDEAGKALTNREVSRTMGVESSSGTLPKSRGSGDRHMTRAGYYVIKEMERDHHHRTHHMTETAAAAGKEGEEKAIGKKGHINVESVEYGALGTSNTGWHKLLDGPTAAAAADRGGGDGRERREVTKDRGSRNGSVHLYAEKDSEFFIHRDSKLQGKITLTTPKPTSLQPDPILRLHKAIGFGGVNTEQALFVGEEGVCVVYPCHSLVVVMDVQSGQQKFFIGHTDKVSCISVTVDGSLLASGQTGIPAVVRLWEVESASCLALFQTHHHGLHSLRGSVLCGVGKDKYGKTLVVFWDTSQLGRSGEVSVLTKAHTEASIDKMRVAGFDSSRMVSCGWNNVRFWRLRDSVLKSCPVDLEEHHHMHFTDVQFQHNCHTYTDLADRNVYACTKSGHLFELHYKKIVILRVWHLLPKTIIHTLAVHKAFCVTGSGDGLLRVWPLDFSAVFIEAEHEGKVTAVDVSEDGLKVLAGTSSGNLGILDASTRSYSTLMRSHADHVTSMSMTQCSPGNLFTCSKDQTLRVWDLPDGPQVFDFRTTSDYACCICAGPGGDFFACGFTSGVIRVFQLPSTTMLAEHMHQSGSKVTGLVFSPSGHLLYSSAASGSLALYSCNQQGDKTHKAPTKLLKILSNAVAKGEDHAPRALSLSQDGSRLAFVGPHHFTITVLDAETLSELLRLDITPVTSAASESLLDSAKLVCFSPDMLNQLLVVTKEARLLRFSASTGQLLGEVGHIHRRDCSSVTVSRDGRFLLTAGDSVVKVWDYHMNMDLNFQVFIGHSGLISEVSFTCDGKHVVSCGDAIFIWEFMGHIAPTTTTTSPTPYPPPPGVTVALSTPPGTSSGGSIGGRSASPRKRVPTPATYNDPLKMQTFTPITHSKPLTISGMDASGESHSNDLVPDENDEQFYKTHDSDEKDGDSNEARVKGVAADNKEGVASWKGDGVNINRFRNRAMTKAAAADNEDHDKEEEDDDDDEMKPLPTSEGNALEELQPPSAQVHLLPPVPKAGQAPRLYLAPQQEAGIQRRAVYGVNGSPHSSNCVIWQSSSGLFVFSSGCLVVLEDLESGTQRHFEGHKEKISTLALQHDGRVVASASSASPYTPCEVRIWSISSGRCTKLLTFHSTVVQSMGYSFDDRFLISIGNYQDGSLAVWSTWDYSLMMATPLSFPVHALSWDPHIAYEFTTVGAACQKGGGVSFWMVEEDMGGKKCQLKVHEPEVPKDLLQAHAGSSGMEFTSVCYGRQPTVFIGSNAGVISLWETVRNSCVMFWRTEPCEITSMLARDGKVLAGNAEGTLQLWLVEDSASPPTVSLSASMAVDDGAIVSVSFNAQMELGVVGSTSGAAWYISWSESNKLKLVGGHRGDITSLAFSDCSSLLASSSLDGSLAVWKVDTREQLVLFQAPKKACLCAGFSPSVESGVKAGKEKDALTSDDADACLPPLVAGYSDGTVRVFDVRQAKMVKKLQPHAEPVRAVAYSVDGRVIVSGCAGGLVAVSSPSTGLIVQVITDHQGAPVTDLQIARKPLQLPSLGETRCWLWLVTSGDRRLGLWSCDWQRDHCKLVDWLTFPGPNRAPNGTRLRRGPKCQYELLPPSLAQFSSSDPDTLLYTGYGLEQDIKFYSISRKTVFRTLPLTHWATSFALSPQGHLLAFGCNERVLKLMDYEEGSFQDFVGHHDSVESLCFSPCGKYLVSSSQSILQLWDVTLQ